MNANSMKHVIKLNFSFLINRARFFNSSRTMWICSSLWNRKIYLYYRNVIRCNNKNAGKIFRSFIHCRKAKHYCMESHFNYYIKLIHMGKTLSFGLESSIEDKQKYRKRSATRFFFWKDFYKVVQRKMVREVEELFTNFIIISFKLKCIQWVKGNIIDAKRKKLILKINVEIVIKNTIVADKIRH